MVYMRKLFFYLFAFITIINTLGFRSSALGQEYTAPNYYYNNFDNGELGAGFTPIGGASLALSPTNLAIEGGYSLSSTGNGISGGYSLSFIPAGTNISNEQFGYEWTMLYRNNGGNTDNSQTIDNNKNSWKYWLFANNSNLADMQGYYLTQNGANLEIRISNSKNDNRALLSFNIGAIGGNNITYAIRVQRVKQNGQSFRLFIDAYSPAKREATTLRAETNSGEVDTYKVYNYAGLQVSSTSLNRFKFDELKMYARKIEIAGANDPAYGFSNPLYDGQKDAVIYALKFRTRGLFSEIYQIQTEIEQIGSASFADIVENARLFRSNDNYFGNADDVLIDKNQSGGSFTPTIGYRTLQANNFQTQIFSSLGTANGLLVDVGALFFKVDLKSNASTKGSFKIAKLAKIGNDNASVNFVSEPTVMGAGTTTSEISAGSIRDWVGNVSPDWNIGSNWSPAGVPGVNDLARIGVSSFKNQPMVSSNQTLGNILFGLKDLALLTINAKAILTVNNNVENLEGIEITGTGTLTIKGSFIVNPTKAKKHTTITANLNMLNLLIDAEKKEVTFNANGSNTTINNTIRTYGDKSAVITVGPNSQLILLGANPFNLGASENGITLNANSTVRYGGAVTQYVKSDLAYKNIAFSGAGLKNIANGSLNVSGNWTSSGGKIDLLSNNPTLSFSGGAQEISDLGTDGGKGLMFGNVTFTGGNTKTLSTGEFALAVGSYLTMGPNTILQANDNLTFKASALGSASVSAVPANASIKGLVTVEKYIQGGSKEMWRTNRMLSSPVYDNTKSFINADGGRTYSFTQFIDDVIITGKGGALNGFDNNAGNAASAWTYVSGKSFVEIPTINTSLEVGKGAYIFYRGDRSNSIAKVTAPFVDAESIVMTFKGTLNQQDVTVPLAAANLLGNPYAATINWNAVKKTENVSSVVRVWNPSIRQYSTFNGRDGVNGGTQYIGPGQAFFVQSTGTGASVTFTESAKISNIAESKPLYNTVMATNDRNLSVDNIGVTNMAFVEEQPIMIRAKLVKNNTENSDETLIVLKSGELATIAGYDVTRTGGESVFLSSLSSDGKQMAINYMPHFKDVSTLKLGVTVDNSGSYTLQFSQQDLPIGYEFNLKDNFLNTRTAITSDGLAYEFDVNKTIAASSGMNRFVILINPITTLPVVISSFSATKVNGGVAVKWTTSTANNHSHFVVQRAGEDKVYTEIATVKAQQNGKYQIIDKNPLVGYNYYRLIQVDQDAKSTVNDPIVVKFELNETSVAGLLVYPTVIDADYNLKYNGTLISTVYEIKITDVSGRRISIQKLQKLALENGFKGVLPSVASGVYFVELVDISTGKSLGVAKLIKR